MRPVTVSVGPLTAASATNIRTASGIAGAGAVVLNGSTVSGGVATLDNPRQVLVTNASNETLTLTLTGTTFGGAAASEVIQLATAGTVASKLNYKTLTSVVSSAASVGNISIGTNALASTPWVRFDEWAMGQVGLQVDVTGTVNYTVQGTMDDPNSPTNPVDPAAVAWINSSDTAVVGATLQQQSNFMFAPIFARVLLNSGTGSISATFVQNTSP